MCRDKGERLNDRYGPKHRFVVGNAEIFVDDYGHYMTVRDTNTKELLCSTHPCDHLYRPGLWARPILDLWEEVSDNMDRKACDALIRKRDEIRKQLGLVEEMSAVKKWTEEEVLDLYKKSKDLMSEVGMNETCSGGRKKEQETAWENLYQHVTKLERKG